MLDKTELSILEPFLQIEQLEWADVVRFGDDLLGMADAPRAGDLDRLADMERQVLGRNEPHRQLPGMETDPRLRVSAPDVADDPHLFAIISQRNFIVLRRDEVQSDNRPVA